MTLENLVGHGESISRVALTDIPNLKRLGEIMVSQPGIGINAARVLKQLCGTTFDEENKPITEKNLNCPFKTEIQAYRFCAMVGLALDKRTTDGMMQTKWSVESIYNSGEKHFADLFSIAGRELDYVDWVDAMNRCADWGAIYISKYYFVAGKFTLAPLIELLNSDSDFTECDKCGAFSPSKDKESKCWKCGG